MIRYYLSEEPVLPQVKTFLGSDESDLAYILGHLEELVVKTVDGSGGYGMLIGPASTAKQRTAFKRRIKATPREFIAQPTIALSRLPIFVDELRPAHIDLRPFVLSGRITTVVPGGLTRAAMEAGLARRQLLAGRRQQGHLGAA